jgi:HlyD family secretion protein
MVLALAAVSRRGNLHARLARLLDGRLREPTAGWRWTAWLVLLTSLFVSGIALAQRQSRLRVQPVQRGPLSIRLEARGTLESSRSVELRSEVQGLNRVVTLAPDNELVRAGDLLVELDAVEVNRQVFAEATNARLAAAERLAQAEADRKSFLADGTDASKLKQAELDAQVAAAQLAADVAAQQLARRQAELEKRKIRSPMDGLFRHYQGRAPRFTSKVAVGAMVRERQIVAHVFDPSQLQVKASIPAPWAGALKPGQAAEVLVDAFPGRTIKGELKQIEPLADSTQGSASGVPQQEAVITLHSALAGQRPGLTATVEFAIVELPDVVRVPVSAIERRDDRAYCLVQTPAGVERREIQIGLSNEQFAEIKRGVKEGEQLVINPWRARRNMTVQRPASRSDAAADPLQPEKSRARREPQRSAPPEPQDSSTRTEGRADSTESSSVKVEFRNAAWSDVLRWLAERMQLNLQVEEMPPGTLDLKTGGPRTLPQVRDTISAALLAQGYTMVRTGELLLVISREKLDRPLIPLVAVDELNQRGEYEVCRVLFPVRGARVDSLASELQPLLSRFGRIIALPASSSLEVMDTVGNLRQLRDLISKAQPDDRAPRQQTAIFLKHAKATTVVTVLRELVTAGLGPEEPPSHFVADERLNAILVSAPPEVLERVAHLVEILDAEVE